MPWANSNLILMPIGEEHLDFWHRLRNDPETMRHQPIQPATVEQLRTNLCSYPGGELENDLILSYRWIILDKRSNEPLGEISFHRIQPEQGIGRVGYSILPVHWNKGVGTRALRQLIDMIFTLTGMERLEAVCSVCNPASRRVLEKAGFKYEGIKRGYLKICGERVDHFSFGLLKSDWKNI